MASVALVAVVVLLALAFHRKHNNKPLPLQGVLFQALEPFVALLPVLAVLAALAVLPVLALMPLMALMPVMAVILVLAVMTPFPWNAGMAVMTVPPLLTLMSLGTRQCSADKRTLGTSAPVALHRVAMEALVASLLAEVLAVSSLARRGNIYPPATLALVPAVPAVTLSYYQPPLRGVFDKAVTVASVALVGSKCGQNCRCKRNIYSQSMVAFD